MQRRVQQPLAREEGLRRRERLNGRRRRRGGEEERAAGGRAALGSSSRCHVGQIEGVGGRCSSPFLCCMLFLFSFPFPFCVALRIS